MEIDERYAVDRLVDSGLLVGRFGVRVDGKIDLISDDDRGRWEARGGDSSNGGWDAEFFDVFANKFFSMNTVDGVLAHAE